MTSSDNETPPDSGDEKPDQSAPAGTAKSDKPRQNDTQQASRPRTSQGKPRQAEAGQAARQGGQAGRTGTQRPAPGKTAPKKGSQGPQRPQGAPAKAAAPHKQPSDRAASETQESGDVSSGKGGLSAVLTRNSFYVDGYRKLMFLGLGQTVAIVALIAALIVQINVNQPENRYFATTEDGRLIPLVPLSAPNLSRPALLSWVAQASSEVMTFGFHDYKRRLQEASRHFTRTGWESFTKALSRARVIDTVTENRQVVTAAPRGAPVLVSEGVFNGRYQWTIELPLLVTYQSGNKTRNDKLLITLVVVRVPSLDSPNGVGIEQWFAVNR